MNVNTLNRTVLAALIASALSVGLSAPQSALARPNQERAAQPQTQTQAEDDEETAREKRERARKEREAAAAARAEQAPQRAPEPAPAVRERDQSQVQLRDREQQQQRSEQQAGLREQQEAIREQNRQTRERNDQVEREREQAVVERAQRDEREQAQAERQRERDGRERAERVEREQTAQRESERQQREQAQADRQRERTERPGDVAQPRDQRQQDRAEQRDERREDRQQAAQHRQEQRDVNQGLRPARRVDNRVRDQRIVREKQQAQSYQQVIQTKVAPQAKVYAESLNRYGRSNGYRYHQQYYWRLLEMLTRWNWQRYNYWNDPYYYTADDYRYYRGGNWYSINRYGADILRQAINYGYQEGHWAGRADRMDGWRFDYRNAFVYRDANYGYRGFYVHQREYNYYFREGFRRGYEDGYHTRRHYGRSYNGSDVILGGVLSSILNLQAYRW